VPAAILRQMARYAAALESDRIRPGRGAALLLHRAPRLIAISVEGAARHKQALLTAE